LHSGHTVNGHLNIHSNGLLWSNMLARTLAIDGELFIVIIVTNLWCIHYKLSIAALKKSMMKSVTQET